MNNYPPGLTTRDLQYIEGEHMMEYGKAEGREILREALLDAEEAIENLICDGCRCVSCTRLLNDAYAMRAKLIALVEGR